MKDPELQVFDILYWSCVSLVVLVGIPIHLVIVHYEWYGGDPQKRSLVNRFMSNGVVSNIVSSVSILMLSGFLRYEVNSIYPPQKKFLADV